MGLFTKKPEFGDYKFELTLRKCVGYVGGGSIQYFWGVKNVKEIQKKGKGLHETFYRASIPDTHDGLPILVILGGALKNAPPVSVYCSNVIAINCNQGTPYGGPFVQLSPGVVPDWEGAIFTYDETHPLFAPLAFDPSDITYGMIATYWNEGAPRRGDWEYRKWIEEQLRGDGKGVSHNNNGLYKFQIFKSGQEPDWNSQRRFIVKNADKLHPFAFKCLDETVTFTVSGF